jgi:hypothetical protein
VLVMLTLLRESTQHLRLGKLLMSVLSSYKVSILSYIAALFLKMRFSLLYPKPNMGFTLREMRNVTNRGTPRNPSRF